MQFLRTVFWVALAILGVFFALDNWRPVTIHLWSDIVLDTPLPMLMLGSFLLGLVPMIVLHRATRWSLRRRLDTTQRELAETRAVAGVPPTTTSEPPGAFAPGSVAFVPPPGGACRVRSGWRSTRPTSSAPRRSRMPSGITSAD